IHRLALALALAVAAPALPAADDISKVNGSIEAAAGQTYGDLETVNGSIRVGENVQAEDVSTVNGSITIGQGSQVDSVETVNGAIRLGRNVRTRGGIETVNGGVFVDRGSVVGGSVETVNGAIGLVATEAAGNIEAGTGDITVGVDSHVRGGITVQRSTGWFQLTPKRRQRIVIGPRAVVEGPLDFRREVDLYVHRTARIGPVSGAEPVVFD